MDRLHNGRAGQMTSIRYARLTDVDPRDFLPLLNSPKTREHLVDHPPFDAVTVTAWMEEKLSADAIPGCRIRAVLVNGRLGGWCGIQRDVNGHEIAIVLGDGFRGPGRTVFRDVMGWAAELGHREIFVHLLHTRRESGFLRSRATKVYRSDFLGSRFTTYRLPVK